MTDQIYVENGVGRAVMDAINLFTPKHGVTAVWQHDVHPEMQRKRSEGAGARKPQAIVLRLSGTQTELP